MRPLTVHFYVFITAEPGRSVKRSNMSIYPTSEGSKVLCRLKNVLSQTQRWPPETHTHRRTAAGKDPLPLSGLKLQLSATHNHTACVYRQKLMTPKPTEVFTFSSYPGQSLWNSKRKPRARRAGCISASSVKRQIENSLYRHSVLSLRGTQPGQKFWDKLVFLVLG